MDGATLLVASLMLVMIIVFGLALYIIPGRWHAVGRDYTTSGGSTWTLTVPPMVAVSRQALRAERRRDGFRLERLADPKQPRREARALAREYQ